MRPMLYLVQKLFVTTQIFVKQHNHKTQKYGITEIDTAVFCLLFITLKGEKQIGLWWVIMVLCCGSCCLVVVGKSAVDLELVPVTTRNSAAAAVLVSVLVGGAAHCSHNISAEWSAETEKYHFWSSLYTSSCALWAELLHCIIMTSFMLLVCSS